MSITRIGTVDDFELHETKLKPRVETFTKDRVSWFCGGKGVEQFEGNYFDGKSECWRLGEMLSSWVVIHCDRYKFEAQVADVSEKLDVDQKVPCLGLTTVCSVTV